MLIIYNFGIIERGCGLSAKLNGALSFPRSDVLAGPQTRLNAFLLRPRGWDYSPPVRIGAHNDTPAILFNFICSVLRDFKFMSPVISLILLMVSYIMSLCIVFYIHIQSVMETKCSVGCFAVLYSSLCL